MFERKSAESGFSLIQSMIATGFLAATLLIAGTMSFRFFRQNRDISTFVQVDVVRNNIVALVSDPAAWAKTVSMNPGLASCLNGVSACPANFVGQQNAKSFALYDGTTRPNAYFNSTDTSNGFTINGDPCGPDAPVFNSPNYFFRPTTSSPDCPIRFEMRWYALTASVRPQIAVYALLQVTPNPATISLARDINRYSIGYCNGVPTVLASNYICPSQIFNPLIRGTR